MWLCVVWYSVLWRLWCGVVWCDSVVRWYGVVDGVCRNDGLVAWLAGIQCGSMRVVGFYF